MIFLLLGTALAQEVPVKPEPNPPAENQCEETTSISDPCSAVVVPTSQAADLLQIEIWGDQVYRHYQTDLRAWEIREQALKAENKKLKRTIWIRAGEAIVIGFAAGYITYHTIQETR